LEWRKARRSRLMRGKLIVLQSKEVSSRKCYLVHQSVELANRYEFVHNIINFIVTSSRKITVKEQFHLIASFKGFTTMIACDDI